MEIKINKEIRSYKESVFFGLSLRQLICSIGAVGIAIALYFCLIHILGKETTSWACLVGAAPVAIAGFFNYNGLTIEKFTLEWLKSNFIYGGQKVFKAENFYYNELKGAKFYDEKL